MDVTEQLQAYITQIVALGQATLAHRRRGEWLPDELAVQAAALLALESEMDATPAAAAPDETAAPVEQVATPGVTAILDEADAPPRPAQPDEWPFVATAPPEPAATPDESSAVTAGVAVMSPIEADNWLSALDEELSGELLILDGSDTAVVDEPLVIDVDEGAGGGPATTGASTALPPLVIDPIHDLSTPSGAFPLPATATEQAAASASGEPSPAADLGFCINCGATLRPGRRFCHRCGASAVEMAAAPPVPPADASLPSPVAALPREEWPTIVSDPPRYVAGNAPAMPAAPAMARFCNNCGLGLGVDVTVCPDCGSRDIS